jgi:hypothetical protein
MAAPRKRVVNYRRCEAVTGTQKTPGFNLQALIDDAAKTVPHPRKREVGIGAVKTHLLAWLVNKHGCTCGTLVSYEKGRKVPLVDVEDGKTWEELVEPLDSKGKKRNMKEQTLFFAVRENHVAIIQSKDLDVTDLLDFLVDLIQTKAGLAKTSAIGLVNLPSKDAVKKMRDHKIKEVKIGASAFSTVREPIPEGESESKTKSKRQKFRKVVKTDGVMMSVLRILLGEQPILDDMEKTADGGSVYVELKIKYKSRTEKDAQQVMKDLAAAVGDRDDLSPEIVLDRNSKITSKELTIRSEVSVQCIDGNFSSDDAMTRLSEWLTAAIKDGTVFP